jgi:DNA-binding LacI/PurR family transcriptional regulator
MAASIKDVARVAGVSASTVSRALTNSPLISTETAARVKRIAEDLHYTASTLGRGLVTGKTATIGMVVTTIRDPFIGEVVSGVEEVANEHGYTVLLACSQADPHREISVIRSLQERRVDGVLVAASRVGARYVEQMSAMKVPVVLINRFHPGDLTRSVMIDNVGAAIEATRHLIKLGHRQIGYLGDRFGLQSDTDRFAGYREALAEADLPFLPELVAHGDGKPDGGVKAAHKLLSSRKRPTAVFCYNDMSALGALQTAASHKLQVPRDLSLVGFDDLFFAAYTQPPLTTIRQPMRKMGCRAMELLLKLLAGKQIEGTIAIEGQLIVRASTAPPPDRA